VETWHDQAGNTITAITCFDEAGKPDVYLGVLNRKTLLTKGLTGFFVI
jgi:hypothetical protein